MLFAPTFADAAGSVVDVDAPSIERAGSVDEAIERITKTLTTQGIEIVVVIDHAAAAASVGLDLPPTKVVLFRNSVLESLALRRSRTIGIVLGTNAYDAGWSNPPGKQ